MVSMAAPILWGNFVLPLAAGGVQQAISYYMTRPATPTQPAQYAAVVSPQPTAPNPINTNTSALPTPVTGAASPPPINAAIPAATALPLPVTSALPAPVASNPLTNVTPPQPIMPPPVATPSVSASNPIALGLPPMPPSLTIRPNIGPLPAPGTALPPNANNASNITAAKSVANHYVNQFIENNPQLLPSTQLINDFHRDIDAEDTKKEIADVKRYFDEKGPEIEEKTISALSKWVNEDDSKFAKSIRQRVIPSSRLGKFIERSNEWFIRLFLPKSVRPKFDNFMTQLKAKARREKIKDIEDEADSDTFNNVSDFDIPDGTRRHAS